MRRAVSLAAVALLAACTATPNQPSVTDAPTATPASSAVASSPASPSPSPTEERLAWGPTVADWDQALATAQALPLEVAAGQVIVADVYSPDPEAAAALVRDRHLGGVILMGGSITGADELAALTEAIAAADDRDWPVWISTDEEGGTVSRLGQVIPRLPAFMAAGAATDKAAVRAAYGSSAADMRALGVNVDLAPDADVTIGLEDPIIRTRSAGSAPSNVAATVVAAMDGFVDAGVVPVIKHFPGHGSLTGDSHDGLPVQRRSVAEMETRDLLPFATAIDAGAPAVMLGHIEVAEWGGGPATLAPAAYAYLREELGFTGVAMTDALNMGAIVDDYSSGEAAAAALAAGADVLLMPASVGGAVDGIVAAVERGDLARSRLDQAAARSILLLRWNAGLGGHDATPGYARSFAAAGATVATGDCAAPLVRDAVTVTGGTDRSRRVLGEALEAHGVTLGGGTEIRLVPSGRTRATADIVVALDGPWGLFDSRAESYVAVYGDSSPTLEGLADVLVGAAPAGGTWPVDMGEAAVPSCAA